MLQIFEFLDSPKIQKSKDFKKQNIIFYSNEAIHSLNVDSHNMAKAIYLLQVKKHSFIVVKLK